MDLEKVKKLHASIIKNGGAPAFEPDEDSVLGAVARAKQLIERGYYQVSGKYRAVACLPKGKTGVEALAEASGDADWAQQLGECGAGDQYLRCYARARGDTLELDPLVWIAYRELGGGTYGSFGELVKTEIEQLRDAKRALEAMTARAREFERRLVASCEKRCLDCKHWDLTDDAATAVRGRRCLQLVDMGFVDIDDSSSPRVPHYFGCNRWRARHEEP